MQRGDYIVSLLGGPDWVKFSAHMNIQKFKSPARFVHVSIKAAPTPRSNDSVSRESFFYHCNHCGSRSEESWSHNLDNFSNELSPSIKFKQPWIYTCRELVRREGGKLKSQVSRFFTDDIIAGRFIHHRLLAATPAGWKNNNNLLRLTFFRSLIFICPRCI